MGEASVLRHTPVRALSIALAIVLLAPMGAATPSDPGDPIVTGFTLSGTQFTAGDTLTIDANVSGTAHYVSFGFYIEDNGSTQNWIPEWMGGPVTNGTVQLSYTFGGSEIGAVYRLLWTYATNGPDAYHQEYDNVTDPNGDPVRVTVHNDNVVDLAVESVNVDDPENDGEVTLRATITNLGNLTASSAVHFWVDDELTYGGDTGSIAPGYHLNFSAPYDATPGLHTFRAVVDWYGHIPEPNESNNERSTSFGDGNATAPDLFINGLGFSPSHPAAGDKIEVFTIVQNAGSASAGPFYTSLSVEGDERERRAVAGLSADDATLLGFEFTPQASGWYHVEVVADVNDTVAESDEANNAASFMVFVEPNGTAMPDLTVTAITLGGSPVSGSSVGVNATLRNNGTANATSFAVALLDDGTEVARLNVSFLAANATTTRTFNWTPSHPGNHTLTASADVDDDVAESNESNNERSTSVNVGNATAPDLVAIGLSVLGSPVANAPVFVNATTRNVGTANASAFTIALLDNGTQVARKSFAALAVNTSAAHLFNWTPTSAGNHTLTLVVDVDGNVTESTESNNEHVRVVSVAHPSINLVAQSITASPPTGPVGSTTTLTGTFRNTGNATASGFIVEIRVDGNAQATQWIPGLAPGANGSVSINWPFEEGPHGVVLYVDSWGHVTETDESDNARGTGVLGIPVVDLGVDITSVTHEPLRTEIGDLPHPLPRHTITFEVANRANLSTIADWTLRANASSRFTTHTTSASIASGNLTLGPGETRVVVVEWDPLAFGDFEVVATVAPRGTIELRPEDNVDRHDDFAFVGGFGGVVAGSL